MRNGDQINKRKRGCPRVVSNIYRHIAVDRTVAAELKGRDEIVIHGCRRICRYTPQHISLSIKCGRINVCGSDLDCYSFSPSDVGIRGRIKCVFFTEEKRNGGRG